MALRCAAEAEKSGEWNPDIAARTREVLHEMMTAAGRYDFHSFLRLADVVERMKKLHGKWAQEAVGQLLIYTGGEGEVNLDQLLKDGVLNCDRKTAGVAARFLGLRVKTGRPHGSKKARKHS